MRDGPTITIENLSKRFGSTQAVDDLSFEVRSGEIFAFLGSNGSGKTTTIRSLLGIYEPDEGRALIDGQLFDEKVAYSLGYIPEERGLYTSSTPLDTLVYFGQLKGLSVDDAKARAMHYLERVELADKADSTIKSLSSGQQQKIQLGVAIINRPNLLILDEPTRGLDPVNRRLLMDIIGELNKEGATVIYTSHDMDDVERIADRLALIHNGKRVLYGNLNQVRRDYGSDVIQLEYEGTVPENNDLYRVKKDAGKVTLMPVEGISTQEILQFLVQEGVSINYFSVDAPSLEEIFIQAVR